jgi:hypothetical protein
MNQIYNDLENKFPVEVDDFPRFSDPDLTAIGYINQYYTLYNAGDVAGATAILDSYPQLKTMIFNASNMNKERDAIISVQRFFFDEVQTYLVEIIKNKGVYNASATYTKYDVVSYVNNGATEYYMGIVKVIPVGTLPIDTNYFIALVLRGEQGASGIGLAPRGAWNSATAYLKDDCVSYNNILWQCLSNNTNTIPVDGSGVWVAIMHSASQILFGTSAPTSQANDGIWYQVDANGKKREFRKTNEGYVELFATTKSNNVSMVDGSSLEDKMNSHTHSPISIIQDTNNKFVSDVEKEKWNTKQTAITYGTIDPTGGNNGDVYIKI